MKFGSINSFPIKCIYNINFGNQKTVKHSQMHSIYLFIHIFTYICSNCSKCPHNELIKKSSSFSVVLQLFLKASSSMLSANR